MDRKTLTIILGVLLIGSFFLPFYSIMGSSVSGLDLVTSKGVSWEAYLLLLIPVSGLLLLLGELNNGNYIIPRSLLTWLPLLTVLFWIIGMPLINGAAFGDIFKMIGKGYGVGLWVAIATSLVLAFYNPPAR